VKLLGRHPSRLELEAWFDGETDGGVGWHVSGCERCLAHIRRVSTVRGAMAATTVPARADAPDAGRTEVPVPAAVGAADLAPAATPHSSAAVTHRLAVARRRSVATAVAAGAVVLAALAGLGEGPLRGALFAGASGSGVRASATAGRGAGDGASGAGSGTGAGAASGQASPGSAAGSVSGAGRSGGTAGVGAGGLPLRLAVVVPTTGPAAAEGSQVVDAVRAAVAEADAAGGVRGAPIQLTVVAAEDPAAVAGLAGHVDAVVGGFGAGVPAGVPWMLPADPAASGSAMVAPEVPAQTAGARMAGDLAAGGVTGPVGVVEGSGPDAALASGIAQALPVHTVSVPDGAPCGTAVATLTAPGSGVDALAVAGPPSLAASCLAALAGSPAVGSLPGGVLLAPSAAYDETGAAALVPRATTVLGLPWPTSSSAGAARFRAAVPGVTSYRAMVSFAATELAVSLSRVTGLVTRAAMTGGSWRSDLVDFAGTANAGAQRVVAGPLGWAATTG
jgi:hypothetical protein